MATNTSDEQCSSEPRDSIDSAFEAADKEARRLSLIPQSSPSGSLDEDRGATGTAKRLPSLSHSSLTPKPPLLEGSRSVGDLSSTGLMRENSNEERNLVCKSNMW